MKRFCLIVLLIAPFLPRFGNGQVLIGLLFGDKLNKGPIEFGLNAFINNSNISDLAGSETRRKLGFGLYLDYKMNEKWTLATALSFASPKGARNFSLSELFFPIPDSLLVGGTVERRLNNLELPVMIQFRPVPAIGISAGLYGSYMTKAVDYLSNNVNQGTLTFERDIREYMNRWDYGVAGGLTYHFKGDPGAQIRVNYMLGLANVYDPTTNRKGHNEVWQIGVLIPIKFGVGSTVDESE